MRGPFPVRYPVHRSLRYLAVLLGGVVASGGTLGGWVWSQWDAIVPTPLRWALAAAVMLCWLGLSVWLVWHWAAHTPLALIWDGQRWWVAPDPPGTQAIMVSAPVVVLDLAGSLWLRSQPEGQARRWWWLDRSFAPQRWADLRRAVYSRARPESAAEATPGRNCADEA